MREQNSIWRSLFFGDAVIEEWSMRGKGASGDSVGDIDSWKFTMPEHGVLQIRKKKRVKEKQNSVSLWR